MSMGWMEIVILLLLAAIVVLAVLPGGGTYDIADETVVRGVTWETADQVLFRELADVRDLTLVEAHAGSYTLSRKSRSGLVIAAAVLLFPLGLIFLLLTSEQRIQVSLARHPDGCRLRVVGRARGRDIEHVVSALQRALPVPDVFAR